MEHSKEAERKKEVQKKVEALGLNDLFNESFPEDKEAKKYIEQVQIDVFNDIVRAVVDIYYARYHSILSYIDNGQWEKKSE